MGCGYYNTITASSYSNTLKGQSRSEIFTAYHLDPEMDIKGKIRECIENEEHPETVPIIIALDVTGSMGRIPEKLIKGCFPEIMGQILDLGIDPEVCFLGIGDVICDKAPFQAGQFEANDQSMNKWLKALYLEGGGGGNDFETYTSAWYFAIEHTNCDAIKKRGKKGILITIGDEEINPNISKFNILEYFGDSVQTDIDSKELYESVCKEWNVHHITMLNENSYRCQRVEETWEMLGKNHIRINREPELLVPTIVNIIKQNVKSDVQSDVKSDEEIL